MTCKLELVHTLEGHKGRVWGVSWHPEGGTFASCGEDKTIRIWSQSATGGAPTTKTILSDGHKRTIRHMSWSPCGKYLASGSFDATTAIWSAVSNEFECNVTLEGHDNEVKSVSWNKGGNLLATCSRDKSVWIWEVTGDEEFDCAAVMNSHSQDVKKVCWHPHEDLLASASYDNTIKIFRENTLDSDWECINTLTSHDSTVWSIDFDSTGQRLVSCSDDKTIKIWQIYPPGNEEGIVTPDNIPAWKCVCTISGEHTRAIYDVSWDKTTGLIATACGDDSIRVFKEDLENSTKNEPTFNLVAKVDSAHSQDVNTVTWNPKQPGQLLSCSDDGTIKIWKFVE